MLSKIRHLKWSVIIMKKAMDILVKIGAMFTAVALMLVGHFSALPESTAEAELIGQDIYVLFDALTMGQGITTDGEYYYTSGCIAPIKVGLLAKIEIATGEIVLRNNFAIPPALIAKGCDHIGGISYYDGLIYASLEGAPYENNFIVLYDAETLEYTGKFYPLEKAYHMDGVPWVCVDAARGYVYTGEWNHAVRLNIYDLETMEFSHHLELDAELHRIQGCEIFDGILYASSDTKDSGGVKEVFSVSLDTGAVSLAFTRNTSEDCEAEGMTITGDGEGNPVFHVIDYDSLVAMFIRHYKMK